MSFHCSELLIAYFIKIIDWLKNKMQQKMLSDQPLRHEPKPKGNGIKMMAFVRWVLCFYAVVFWRLLCGGMPQYLCVAFLCGWLSKNKD